MLSKEVIKAKFERARIKNLIKQHASVLRKLDELCQELSDMDTREFIEVYNVLIEERDRKAVLLVNTKHV